jgi:phospholipid/cholesterol/gamma-HCH transport system permease protein
MNAFRDICESFGAALLMVARAASHWRSLPRQFPRFIDQCYMIGYTTMPIVTILSFFIGGVLALQSGHSMEAQGFGAKHFIGTLVGLSMCRELGPIIVAILVTGRVGSAITAELASMNVYQEIDALVTMNIPPERILVLPRLAAVLVMMPVLGLISNICGWYGGALVCQTTAFISIEPQAYFASLTRYMELKDIMDGLMKTEVFGFVIVVICCHVGISVRGGPREIGASVTKAIVVSLIFILVLDYFVTKALL